MSFLAGRIAAAKEGSYFLKESKNAVGRLAQKLPASASPPGPPASAQSSPDVLPEILRHSVPIKGTPPPAGASLDASSRWALPPGEAAGSSPDALNPLRSFVSLPQATFGPKRWQLQNEQPQYSASTANDRRRDKSPPPMDPEKLKAVIAGYSQIGKAFVAATILVFGGATAALLYTADKLQLHSVDDVRTKGKDALRPRADMIKEKITPLRSWAEEMSRKWHFEGDKEAKEKSVMVRQLSRALGARIPPN
ncbi:hypothetical protein EJB05_45477 [Eragrostis curvula]|uniref:Uncharacterized protein n=1 Tax=Eragrostis curvula TaxID=38414 RepID=A0A5J9TLT9_9POAL|nr:hypothetical protein EJB05_55352 [Eragrostis curvula]TVU11868.1 hypothetical protein EJB05_45477 [Eragrostis curvula]